MGFISSSWVCTRLEVLFLFEAGIGNGYCSFVAGYSYMLLVFYDVFQVLRGCLWGLLPLVITRYF